MASWFGVSLADCRTPSTTSCGFSFSPSAATHPARHPDQAVRGLQTLNWQRGLQIAGATPESTTNMVICVLGKYGNILGHMGNYWRNGNQSCLTTIPRIIGLIAGIAALAILCHTGCSSPRSHGQLWVCACKIVQMACEQDSLAQPHIMISFPVLRKHTDILAIQNIPANHFLSLHTTRHTHPSNSRINATLIGKSTMLKPAKLTMFWLQYPLVI